MIRYVCFLLGFGIQLILSTVSAQSIFIVDTVHMPSNAPVLDSVIVKRELSTVDCSIENPDIIFLLGSTTGNWEFQYFPLDATVMQPDAGVEWTFFVSGENDIIPDGYIGATGATLGPEENYALFAPEIQPTGIAADRDQLVYQVGTGVTLIEVVGAVGGNDDIVTYLGDLPPAFQAGGQMTLHQESFYYQSVNNELIQFKVRDGNFFFESIGPLPEWLVNGGMATVPITCDSATTYLAHRTDTISTIYELDVQTATLTEYCQIPYHPFSLLYEFENQIIPCELSLDLNTLSVTEQYRYDTICTGTVALLDANIALSPNLEFDSVVVTLMNPLDGGSEWLYTTLTDPEVMISGQNSHSITLSSTGFTRANTFSSVLSGLHYHNDLNPATIGERQIAVQAFHPQYTVDTSFIFLDLGSGDLTLSVLEEEPSCFGDANGNLLLIPESGTAPYAVVWADGQNSLTQSNLAAGQYAVTITDAEGCRVDSLIELGEPEELHLVLSAQQDSICGTTGILLSTPSGGVPPYQFNWSNGTVNDLASSLPPGTYQLTLTDANDCQVESSYTLYEAETLEEYEQITLCSGEAFDWQGITLTQDTSLVLATQSVDGCDSLYYLDLAFLPTYFSEETFSLCAGESITLEGETFTQDTLVTWQWMTSSGCDSTYQAMIQFNSSSTELLADICAGETYSFQGDLLTTSGLYVATLTNAQGCDSTVTLDLSVHPLPEPIIHTDGSLCDGGEMTLSADGYTAYSWSTGAQSANTAINTAGIYTLTVTDAQGCTGSSAITISEEELLIDWAILQPSCPGDEGSLVIDAISGGQGPYLLQINDQQLAVPGQIDQLASGSYWATVEDQSGCIVTIEAIIEEPQEQVILLEDEFTLTLGDSVRLTPMLDFIPESIYWSPPNGLSCTDCLEPFARPLESTRYTLEVESLAGCAWSLDTWIRVERKGVFVPSAFSPNDDGRNDAFTFFVGPSVATVSQFQVYDRWGSQVFSGATDQWAWDGTIRGQPAPAGMYVFLLEWEDAAGVRFQEKGEVVLIR